MLNILTPLPPRRFAKYLCGQTKIWVRCDITKAGPALKCPQPTIISLQGEITPQMLYMAQHILTDLPEDNHEKACSTVNEIAHYSAMTGAKLCIIHDALKIIESGDLRLLLTPDIKSVVETISNTILTGYTPPNRWHRKYTDINTVSHALRIAIDDALRHTGELYRALEKMRESGTGTLKELQEAGHGIKYCMKALTALIEGTALAGKYLILDTCGAGCI